MSMHMARGGGEISDTCTMYIIQNDESRDVAPGGTLMSFTCEEIVVLFVGRASGEVRYSTVHSMYVLL